MKGQQNKFTRENTKTQKTLNMTVAMVLKTMHLKLDQASDRTTRTKAVY